jgi:hypothetical protein
MLVRRAILIAPIVLYGLLNIGTQQYYVDRSRAVPSRDSATFVEIPDASASRLLEEFATLKPLAQRPNTTFISDTFNIVYAKIENFYTRPARMIFPSDDFLRANFSLPTDQFLLKLLVPAMRDRAIELSSRRQRHFRRPNFTFIESHGLTEFDGFFADSSVPDLERYSKSTYVLADTALQSVLNRWYNNDRTRNFQVIPLNRVHDHLIFIGSTYGLGYYARSKFTALFQLEPDVFYGGHTMAGIGRRLLLNIINPGKKIRLELWYTTTLKDDGECRLYNPVVLGAGRRGTYGDLVGRGSTRAFLPAIEPRMLVKQPYILLDMGVNGSVFPERRSGLMGLYGRHVLLDPRRLVAFARDISAISEEDYQRLRPPRELNDLPKNMLNPNLEYSGAYEDGWVSEAAQFVLSHPSRSSALVVRGLVPLIDDPNFHSTLRVLIADREVGSARVGVGTFALRFPVPSSVPARAKVTLRFDRFQRLPNGDRRPIAMKMYTVGFNTPEQAAQSLRSATLTSRDFSRWWDAMAKARIDFGTGWYPLETYAGQTFRWANNDAQIIVHANTTDHSKLQLDVEPGPGESGHAAVLHLVDSAGHEMGTAEVVQRQTVTFPLKASVRTQTYVLHIEGGGTQIPSDPRILDFRVFAAAVR